MLDIQLKAKNYKCFGEEAQGFDVIYPINIIVGRNNSGKSSVVDLIDFYMSRRNISGLGHNGGSPEVFFTKKLTENEIRASFPSNTSGGSIGGNHQEYGMRWVGQPITISLEGSENRFLSAEPQFTHQEDQDRYIPNLVRNLAYPLGGKILRRIKAERDVVPEEHSPVDVKEDGRGATNAIQHIINLEDLNSAIVEVNLLEALNKIFEPDGHFTRIGVQKIQDSEQWEIYLDEEGKGRIKLSNSGSGLKTLILVLINVILLPYLKGEPLSKYVFVFEEVENNLHPGLQRRLLDYLMNIVRENEGCYLFLTTHSSVFIDVFSHEENAQIIHVQHEAGSSQIKKVATYTDSSGILDDLDVRASDLLQANGIVWVEGPSDRLYFNKWVELFSDGEIKEDLHYKCMYYGGRLLSHLKAKIEDLDESNPQEIEILRINRHALMIIDSDKRDSISVLNQTKTRIQKEIEAVGGIVWITAGREIENYIPPEALRALYRNLSLPSPRKFQSFPKYLEEKISPKESKNFLRSKVTYAEKISALFTRDMLATHQDLAEKIEASIRTIKDWNRL